MSEPTHQDDTHTRGDWSQVYTNLDWVARWMADRGYTDAEIAYVVDRPVTPAVAEASLAPVTVSAVAEVSLAPVTAPVEAPVDVPVGASAVAEERGTPGWTIPLAPVEPSFAPAADAQIAADDTEDPEPSERVPA